MCVSKSPVVNNKVGTRGYLGIFRIVQFRTDISSCGSSVNRFLTCHMVKPMVSNSTYFYWTVLKRKVSLQSPHYRLLTWARCTINLFHTKADGLINVVTICSQTNGIWSFIGKYEYINLNMTNHILEAQKSIKKTNNPIWWVVKSYYKPESNQWCFSYLQHTLEFCCVLSPLYSSLFLCTSNVLSQNPHLLTEFQCLVSPSKNEQQNDVDKIVYKEFSNYVILWINLFMTLSRWCLRGKHV